MPLSKSGKHFSRPADAARADAVEAPALDLAPDMGDPGDEDDGQSVTITKKPDGSFCTEQGGEVVEHPDMASAIEALGGAFKSQPIGEEDSEPAMPEGSGAEEEQY